MPSRWRLPFAPMGVKMRLATLTLIASLSCVGCIGCARFRTETQTATTPAIELLEDLRLELIEVARKIGRREYEAARHAVNLLCRKIGAAMTGRVESSKVESVLNEATKALQEIR